MNEAMIERDKKVLEYIGNYFDRYNYAPAIREICADLGIKSTATVHMILQRLAENGLIRFSPNLKRTIELTSRPPVQNIPLVGTISAGIPILAEENIEGYFPVPANMFGGGDFFMLTVSGDSMQDAGILDGDSIIVRKQETAEQGEMIAALVDDSATVKYFYCEEGRFRLEPANVNYKPMYFDELQVMGSVVGLFRKI